MMRLVLKGFAAGGRRHKSALSLCRKVRAKEVQRRRGARLATRRRSAGVCALGSRFYSTSVLRDGVDRRRSESLR